MHCAHERHRLGWIPGPEEEEGSFLERISLNAPESDPDALGRIEELFGMRPKWIEVSYSNRGLLPWQAGITEISEQGMKIQVRRRLKKKKSLLGIYSKGEILAHEMVHGVRQKFDEPVFEEILAYQTSSSPFRRYFGPIFRCGLESSAFLLALFGYWIPWGWTLPLITTAFFLGRLIRGQRLYKKCLRTCAKRLQSQKRAVSFLLYLTDKEIYSVAKGKKVLPDHTYRWKQIALLFPEIL